MVTFADLVWLPGLYVVFMYYICGRSVFSVIGLG